MGPIGKNATVESVFKEAMRHMKNAANKVWKWFKGLNVSIVGISIGTFYSAVPKH